MSNQKEPTQGGGLPSVPLQPVVGGFDPAFFPDCQWCVLTPWIATLVGMPYRAHIADGSTEKEARHIAYQLNRIRFEKVKT